MDIPAASDIDRVLHEAFGFRSYRPGQRDIVERLVSGRNVLAIMPTGAGKSICYQVPALVKDGLTVVVSPLVSLMDDQVAGLKANGIAAACIHSGKSREDNVEDWRAVARGDVKLLYLSPERLMTDRMMVAIERLRPVLFVVDEAHCISKWGAAFRPEYAALSVLKDRFPEAAIAGFTATADTVTQRDIADQLFGGAGDVIVHGFDRPNLWLGVEPKTKWRDQLLGFMEPRRGQSGIVYCLSRQSTEDVARLLNESGYRALPYHAGLPAETRKENQEIFMAGEAVVMVATIAFGMGIDKPDIRFVFHLNLPSSMEAYYQEIGRAGRDGAPADVFMIYGLDDIRMRRQFIEQDGEDREHQQREHRRLDTLLAYCEASACRRTALLAYFGEAAEPCGNCDVCLDPPKLLDGTAEARMLFAAAVGTGERFGATHLVDIVRGAETEKVQSFGHDKLPVFGEGKAHSKAFWLSIVRQAVAGGYLLLDIERFGALRLSDPGRRVLKDGEPFRYREVASPKKTSAARRRSGGAPAALAEVDSELFAHLKELRRELASERNVPAYVVFSDRTLIDMCALKPRSLDEMSAVNGVGPAKLKEFGEVFLKAVAAEGAA